MVSQRSTGYSISSITVSFMYVCRQPGTPCAWLPTYVMMVCEDKAAQIEWMTKTVFVVALAQARHVHYIVYPIATHSYSGRYKI